jgi:pyrroloquinoline-quinone synthase
MKGMTVCSNSFMQSFQALTEMHPLWTHPFLKRCRAGDLSLPEVQILAVQMYKFSKQFTRILASILSLCPDDQAQMVILENLCDEMGQGDLAQAHPELFRHFTRAIGIDDDELNDIPAEPETQAMIDTYLGLSHQYGYLSALGAVCFASEGIVNSLYTQLYHGIQGSAPLPQSALIFFEVHIGVDDSHAANLAALIEPRLRNEAQALDMHRAVLEAMDARVQFFDGIERRIRDRQFDRQSQSSISPQFEYAIAG